MEPGCFNQCKDASTAAFSHRKRSREKRNQEVGIKTLGERDAIKQLVSVKLKATEILLWNLINHKTRLKDVPLMHQEAKRKNKDHGRSWLLRAASQVRL